ELCSRVSATFSLYLGTIEGVADFGFQCSKRYPFSLFCGLPSDRLDLRPSDVLDSSEHIFGFDPAAPPPPPPPPLSVVEPPGENPVFNLLDVLLIVVIAIGALIVCSTIAVAVFYFTHGGHLDPKELSRNVLVFLPAQVAAYILTVGF